MEPLTIDQLKALGFDIAYDKRKGEKVFRSAYHTDYKIDDLVGGFYGDLPTFKEIVEQIAEKATEREKQRIKEKLSQNFLGDI